MSIPERREAVRFLVTRRISVQRACVLLQLQRATFRYQPRPVATDGVDAELRALAQEQPRYGYRRMWALLRRKRTINPKRVHRLWKHAGLQVKREPEQSVKLTGKNRFARLKGRKEGAIRARMWDPI